MKIKNLMVSGIMSIIFAVGIVNQAMARDAAEENDDFKVKDNYDLKAEDDYDLKLLGKYLFFDKISNPPGMACATCHDPSAGWTAGDSGTNLHQVAVTGANQHTAGNLKPPTNAYASLIAPYSENGCSGRFGAFLLHCGGNFWDGRAEGNDSPVHPTTSTNSTTQHLGSEVFKNTGDPNNYAKYFGPTADQALNPFTNPVEQNISRRDVCMHAKSARYAPLYKKAWGEPINCNTDIANPVISSSETQFDISFKRLVLAIGAYQHSREVNSFSSKRDSALAKDRDSTPGNFPLKGFTAQENWGHDLFHSTSPALGGSIKNTSGLNTAGKAANCSLCHISGNSEGTSLDERYTDDNYHNIGVPFNPEIPGTPNPSLGLFSHTGIDGSSATDKGLVKTPTLRNLDKRKDKGFIKAYTHNGWFKSLESIVHFYNSAGAIGLNSGDMGKPGSTAESFGVTRCPAEVTTEKDALAHNCWPAPEHNKPNLALALGFIGNLHLTRKEEAAIVAYLKTFSDTVTPKNPKPYKEEDRN